jgi:putative phosphoribosyl transferase
MERTAKISDLLQLRNRIGVFRDRADAGKVLAGMMESYHNVNAIVLAIPAGGVPVGAMIAKKLELPLDVAVTTKITLPWNPEAGYGAVAFDGTVKLNEGLISYLGLSHREIRQGIERTTQKVRQRLKSLRGDRPLPELSGRTVVLVDDGLASGFTMRTAVEALHKAQAEQIVVAVPTAHQESLGHLIQEVDVIYCPNIRSGWSFAVADAYQYWSDMEEKEIEEILRSGQKGSGSD